MTITDSAKEMLHEALKASGNDSIQMKLQKSCCGTSLFFQMTKLTEGDIKAIYINEVPFIMDKEVIERTSAVTIDYKDGELVMNDPDASSCG